eukprot:500163_1
MLRRGDVSRGIASGSWFIGRTRRFMGDGTFMWDGDGDGGGIWPLDLGGPLSTSKGGRKALSGAPFMTGGGGGIMSNELSEVDEWEADSILSGDVGNCIRIGSDKFGRMSGSGRFWSEKVDRSESKLCMDPW